MTEKDFIALINGNKKIITSVYNNYCISFSEKDITQEILLNAWQSVHTWKQNCKFSTWLYNIARNVCVDKLRRQKTQPIIYYGLTDYIDIIAHEPDTKKILNQIREAIKYDTVLNNLPPDESNLFELYIHGLSYDEISKQTGINENSLRVKINRIKKRLKLRYG